METDKTNRIDEVVIPWWFDRHYHGRDGAMLRMILQYLLNQCTTGAVFMGNLDQPFTTTTVARAIAYRDRIASCIRYDNKFNPRMTCYLTDDTDPDEVVRGYEEGVWCAVKLYMADQQGQGGTTGSQHGVKNLIGRYPVFATMERRKIAALIHLEAVEEDIDEFDREIVSLERDLVPLLRDFPELPVVVEHITDCRVADFVAEVDHPIYATVTPHHLMINRNAMFRFGAKRGMSPGHYCLPVPKREWHRLKIRKYVTSGHPRFGAGTDSAPHDQEAKSRCYGCAAGMFHTNPVEVYTTVFAEDTAPEHLEEYLGNFLSRNFLDVYGMEVSQKMMTIRRTPCLVPQKVGSVQVFMGGTTLPWTLIG